MASDASFIRTFVALPLPAAWIEALESAIAELKLASDGNVRWVRPDGIHLTLRFLGSTDPSMKPRILDGLRGRLVGATVPELSLAGLGAFPAGRNPRVVWAGVTGDTEALNALHALTEGVATSLGWPPERRPFRPHLTLGRVRDRASASQRQRIAGAIAAVRVAAPLKPWRAEVIRLYQSELTPQGAIYTNLGEVDI